MLINFFNAKRNDGSISFQQAMKMADEIRRLKAENDLLKSWLAQLTQEPSKETEKLPALFKFPQ